MNTGSERPGPQRPGQTGAPAEGAAGRVAAPEEAGPGTADRPTERPGDGREGEVSARRVADRVRSCPDVADLSRGPFGVVATYLPGGLVPGVAIRDEAIEVHVVARYGRPLPEVADLVRDAIGDLAAGRRVDVTIADVVTDDSERKE